MPCVRTFSSLVRRDTISRARVLMSKEVSQKGSDLAGSVSQVRGVGEPMGCKLGVWAWGTCEKNRGVGEELELPKHCQTLVYKIFSNRYR